jgi:hypothetical protein
VTFSSIAINCDGTNNLLLNDNLNTFDYCQSLGLKRQFQNSFTFVSSTSYWIKITKKGLIKFKFTLQMLSTYMPSITLEPISTTSTTTTTTTSTTTTTTSTTTTTKATTTQIKSVLNSQSDLVCGVPAINRSFKIIGGFTAYSNSWPWQAWTTDYQYLCGAVLIDRYII